MDLNDRVFVRKLLGCGLKLHGLAGHPRGRDVFLAAHPIAFAGVGSIGRLLVSMAVAVGIAGIKAVQVDMPITHGKGDAHGLKAHSGPAAYQGAQAVTDIVLNAGVGRVPQSDIMAV